MIHTPDAVQLAAVSADLWDYLRLHHRGAARAIKEADLARVHAMNPRRLQVVIEDLIVERRKPICSSCRPPYGVYVAETQDEKAQYARQLEHRIIGLAKRLRAFTHNPLVHVETQQDFFSAPSIRVHPRSSAAKTSEVSHD